MMPGQAAYEKAQDCFGKVEFPKAWPEIGAARYGWEAIAQAAIAAAPPTTGETAVKALERRIDAMTEALRVVAFDCIGKDDLKAARSAAHGALERFGRRRACASCIVSGVTPGTTCAQCSYYCEPEAAPPTSAGATEELVAAVRGLMIDRYPSTKQEHDEANLRARRLLKALAAYDAVAPASPSPPAREATHTAEQVSRGSIRYVRDGQVRIRDSEGRDVPESAREAETCTCEEDRGFIEVLKNDHYTSCPLSKPRTP